MRLKVRECPYCHRLVSIKVCSKYLLRGTVYTVYCNHCNTELALTKEPIPFKWCLLAGFLSTMVPAEFFLYVLKLGLVKSLLCAALIGIIVIGVISLLILGRIRFKRFID